MKPELETQSETSGSTTRTVAVIDVGSTSIRMAIAEIAKPGAVRILETVSQAVTLGKDTFTTGFITQETTEQCVRVLKSYQNLLREYDIRRPDQIRVVATSAVREAENRLAFLDRLYIATGLDIDPLDEAEANRVTYLGILPYLKTMPGMSHASVVVTEIGGGSTEMLVVQSGDIVFSKTYRLGSLRLRKTLEAYRPSVRKLSQIMRSHVKRTMVEFRRDIFQEGQFELIALGGDIRFAATQLEPEWNHDELCRLNLEDLRSLSDKLLDLPVDMLVREYHLPYPDAETLGSALLAYVELADVLDLGHVYVSNVNLRDGLIQEMAGGGAWTPEFIEQISRSAIALGRKYQFDEIHAQHVANLSRMLFHDLQEEHRLAPQYEVILYAAALLHEIGLFVGMGGHHKHSMYLILNSELFGLSRKNLQLVSLVARYHRRSSPKPGHTRYATLEKEDRVAVSKMSALLRVAKALDESRRQRIQETHCSLQEDKIVIEIPGVDDLSLEQLALEQTRWFFEEVFGLQVVLRAVQQPTHR